MPPKFSIGLTVFKRRKFLRECVASVLAQTCGDFELLIGNDDPRQEVTSEWLGVEDSRLQIINRPENLGEEDNMNDLLARSRGKYFSWLADDDLYAPSFLASVRESLRRHGDIPYIVSEVVAGEDGCVLTESGVSIGRKIEGRQFVAEYLERSKRIVGCYAFFDKNYLAGMGGIRRLGSGFGPYSDNRLAILAGALPEVLLIDAPLVFFREHAESLCTMSEDVEAYTSAQRELLTECMPPLRSGALAEDVGENVYSLIQWCVKDYCSVVCRAGGVSRTDMLIYAGAMMKHGLHAKGHRYHVYLVLKRSLGSLRLEQKRGKECLSDMCP